MEKETIITEEDVARGTELLGKYKSAKASIERRVIQDEEWWKMRSEDGGETTGWLFNAVANKHADAMDNIPTPFVLPREEGDRESAEELSAILPVLLDQTSFERVYSEVWYDKLKHGTGCYGVFWNPARCRGKGDVEIKKIDVLNLFWEGGVTDLQLSRNLFYTQLWDNDLIREKYPHVKELGQSPVFAGAKYLSEETENTEGKSVVVDWYYKRRKGNKDILHLCKFCSGQLLFASENEERYKDGIYAHGKYPFFFDKLYTVQGSPCGFGLVDAMKNTQSQIDRLTRAVVKSAELSSSVRYFIRTDGSVNEEEFADFTKPFVHVHGSRLGEDSLRAIASPPVDQTAFMVLDHKINELKETAGNRDFSQGATASGVTAASAIAALQEAGSKLSRDMISGTYEVYREVILTVIELIREFYDLPRVFRIIGDDGSYSFVRYSSSAISKKRAQAMGHDFGEFEPHFDVSVFAQKKSPFSRVTQNELAKEFYSMGLFDPSRRAEAVACVSMMEFEGKDKLLKMLSEGGGATPEKEAFTGKDPLSSAVSRAAGNAALHS